MITLDRKYRFLEFVRGEAMPYIRDTRINAGHLGIDFYNPSWGYKSLEHLASDRGLPMDAVEEAIAWYDANKELVTIECAKRRKKCRHND